MHLKYLPHFLLDLKKPLGCEAPENLWDAAKAAFYYKLCNDQEDRVLFNSVLFSIFFYRYKQIIYQQGGEAAKEKIRQLCKVMKFRMAYRRRLYWERRSNIGPQLKIDGRVNSLTLQFQVLICLKSW